MRQEECVFSRQERRSKLCQRACNPRDVVVCDVGQPSLPSRFSEERETVRPFFRSDLGWTGWRGALPGVTPPASCPPTRLPQPTPARALRLNYSTALLIR
jgi:hypothetical protein